jgi:general secretion pathway protein L
MILRDDIMRFTRSAGPAIAATFHWWLAELSAMLPPKIKQSLVHARDSTVIYIDPDSATIFQIDAGGSATEIFRGPVDKPDIQGLPASRLTAAVALPSEAAYIERSRLPAAAQPRLRDAVAIEAARRSPFRRAEALFDFRITGRTAGGKLLEIEWAAVPAERVQAAQAATRRLGYFPAAVGLAPPGATKLDFVFQRQKPPLSFRLRPGTAAMFLSFLFFLAALTAATCHQVAQAEALERQAASLKPAADKAQKTAADLDALQKALTAVAQHTAEPRTLDILRAVTDALPDDSWVSEFTLNGDQLRLVGSSAIAPSLPERLAAVPLFDHPQFRAPITPLANSPSGKNLDRFDISLTIPSRHATGDTN